MSDCLFCKISTGEIPSTIEYENDRVIAFKDINPQAPVHILIIPRKPIPSLKEAKQQDSALLGHLLIVASNIAQKEGLEDWRTIINTGAAAGQTVFHLHIHILGGRSLRWPPG